MPPSPQLGQCICATGGGDISHAPESTHVKPGGGGGGLRFGSDGGVPLPAEAAKPVPIFKGHFGGKGCYPLLGVFIQENYVFVYFSDEMGENI